MSFKDYVIFGSHRDAPCCLHINQPVTASTLADILSIPLHWREALALQHITGIERLNLSSGDGEIIGTNSGRRLLPLGNSSPHLVISTPLHAAPSPGLCDTIQQIAREIHPSTDACYTAWKKPTRYVAPRAGKFVRELTIYLGSRDEATLVRCFESVSAQLTYR
jgi:hypothetical protein